MAAEVVVPQASAGEGMEMTLSRWLKREGEEVRAGEPLFELDTEKATLEVEAADSGVLTGVLVKQGQPVEPLQLLAYLLAPGQELPASQATVAGGVANAPTQTDGSRAAGATPRARQLAAEHGIELGPINGTGPGGFITTKDVEGAIAAQSR